MLDVLEETVRFLEGQNKWLLTLQFVINQKTKCYEQLRTKLNGLIFEERRKNEDESKDAVEEGLYEDINPTGNEETEIIITSSTNENYEDNFKAFCNGEMNDDLTAVLQKNDLQEMNKKTDLEASLSDALNRSSTSPSEVKDDYYNCEYCGRRYKTKRLLNCHMRLHTGKGVYICTDCPKIFSTSTNYKIHRRVHTGEKPFRCKMCDKAFSQSSTRNEHMRIHTGEKPHKCPKCGKKFAQQKSFNRHVKSTQAHIGLSKMDVMEGNGSHDGEKPYKCKICPKTFIHQKSYLRHTKMHGHDMPDDKQQNATVMEDDSAVIEKLFQCDYCGKQYKQISALNAHIRLHIGAGVHACDDCDMTFTSSHEFNTHRRVHTGEKPYQCEYCPHAFAKRSTRSSHMLIHTGEKPFKCDICGKSFRQKSACTTHMRVHTGEKPFQCEHCDKAFAQKKSLNKHSLQHENMKLEF